MYRICSTLAFTVTAPPLSMPTVAAADFHNARVFFSQPIITPPAGCAAAAGLADKTYYIPVLFSVCHCASFPPTASSVVTVLHAVTAAANAIKNEKRVRFSGIPRAYRICPTLTF